MEPVGSILLALRPHSTALRAFGVRKLGLFGSAARNEATPASDFDFLVELERKTFDDYMSVKELLEQLYQRKIDLVLADGIKPQLRDRILREAVYAEGF